MRNTCRSLFRVHPTPLRVNVPKPKDSKHLDREMIGMRIATTVQQPTIIFDDERPKMNPHISII